MQIQQPSSNFNHGTKNNIISLPTPSTTPVPQLLLRNPSSGSSQVATGTTTEQNQHAIVDPLGLKSQISSSNLTQINPQNSLFPPLVDTLAAPVSSLSTLPNNLPSLINAPENSYLDESNGDNDLPMLDLSAETSLAITQTQLSTATSTTHLDPAAHATQKVFDSHNQLENTIVSAVSSAPSSSEIVKIFPFYRDINLGISYNPEETAASAASAVVAAASVDSIATPTIDNDNIEKGDEKVAIKQDQQMDQESASIAKDGLVDEAEGDAVDDAVYDASRVQEGIEEVAASSAAKTRPVRPKPLPLKRSCQKCLTRPRVLWFVKDHSCYFCIECYNSAFNLTTTYRPLPGAPDPESLKSFSDSSTSSSPESPEIRAVVKPVAFPPPLVFCAYCGIDDCEMWHAKNGENFCDTCHDLDLASRNPTVAPSKSKTTAAARSSLSTKALDVAAIEHDEAEYLEEKLQHPAKHHQEQANKKAKKAKKVCNLCQSTQASRWLNDRDAEGCVICQKCYLRRYRGNKLALAPNVRKSIPRSSLTYQTFTLPSTKCIVKTCADCHSDVSLPVSQSNVTLLVCQPCAKERGYTGGVFPNMAIGTLVTEIPAAAANVPKKAVYDIFPATTVKTEESQVAAPAFATESAATDWEAIAMREATSMTATTIDPSSNSYSSANPSPNPLKRARSVTSYSEDANENNDTYVNTANPSYVRRKPVPITKHAKAPKIQRICTRCDVQESIAWYRDPKQAEGHHCRRCYLELKKKRTN